MCSRAATTDSLLASSIITLPSLNLSSSSFKYSYSWSWNKYYRTTIIYKIEVTPCTLCQPLLSASSLSFPRSACPLNSPINFNKHNKRYTYLNGPNTQTFYFPDDRILNEMENRQLGTKFSKTFVFNLLAISYSFLLNATEFLL